MTAVKVLLGMAACACVAIAFSVMAFMIGFGAGEDVVRVGFFAAVALIGVAGIVGLFFRGRWGAILIVTQAVGLILFWLVAAGRSSTSWLIPGVPVATALLGAIAIALISHEERRATD
jgi:hypothetical protein